MTSSLRESFVVEPGVTAKVHAERYGVSYGTVISWALERGLKFTGKRGNNAEPRNSERRAKIVSSRESGLTYQAIGDDIGISRERVRQILHSEGRHDLCFQPNSGPGGDCINCGKELTGDNRHTKKCCDWKCASEYAGRTLTPREMEIVEIVTRRRGQGERWKAIAHEIGFKTEFGLPSYYKKCLAKIERARA